MISIISRLGPMMFFECCEITPFRDVLKQMGDAGYRIARATDLVMKLEEIPQEAFPFIVLMEEGGDSIWIVLVTSEGCNPMEIANPGRQYAGVTWNTRFRYAGVQQ